MIHSFIQSRSFLQNKSSSTINSSGREVSSISTDPTVMIVPRFHTLAGLFVCGIQSRGRALLSREKHSFCDTFLRRQPFSNDISAASNEADTTESTNWLVVGDGDLSYSSTIAEDLSKSNVQLYATVLEEESVHNRVYKRSIEHSKSISQHENHRLRFGIDATKLEAFFPHTQFDCIEFNFPHWRGKTNHRYNRELLSEFLQSAANVIKADGEIRVALCDGQGGMPAESLTTWKQSWMAAMYAGSHGLLLGRLEPYDPGYFLSSHRGVDRPFSLGKSPQKYTFSLPNGKPIDIDLQVCCRHELRIVLDEKLEKCPVSFDDIVGGDAVFDLARQFVPEGINFEVPARDLLSTDNKLKSGDYSLAVFLLNYSGESEPLSRQKADSIRASIEAAIIDQWNLNVAKPGRMVSKPYPYALLSTLIKEYDI